MNVGRALLAAWVVGLAGCSLVHEQEPPVLPVAERWRESTDDEAQLPPWRVMFADVELQGLIEQALEHNREVLLAVLRIDEVRALHGVAWADQWPALGINAGTQRRGVSALDSPSGQSLVREQGHFRLGLTAFELDLWGRVRALREAAGQRLAASREDVLSAQLGLVGEVAATFYEYLANVELGGQSQASLEQARAAARLIGRRQALGLANELELRQADALVLSLEAELAQTQRELSLSLNRLELLVGAAVDGDRLAGRAGDTSSMLSEVAPGLPSDLLLRRPDIRAAEARLRAFNAHIGAARAAFLPSISLTGLFGLSSPQLGQLFSGQAREWSFSPQLDLPLFDMGRRFSQLDLSRAQREIALVEYQRVIQQAFREVADALGSNRPLAARLAAQQRLVDNEARRAELAQRLYEGGLSSYLEVLDARRGLNSARQTLVRVRLSQTTNRIALYKSLGGGWPSVAPE
ncbi:MULTISPECIES: efflux transporter outer membrane subunit [Pseudomonas]|uniref:efflux transporter outer membrane subunit n=1 Tax=Pseudomonas TaxID=286 RepID=UPI0023618623|nr:efflux transporter outer membrane subunit [Pseudomonas asplenii]